MGNDIGKGATNRMAIAAMSNVTSVEKKELLTMKKNFAEIAARSGLPDVISKDEFTEGLGQVPNITDSDKEILERLFIMLDKTGDYTINYKEFMCGIAPLITGTVSEKLNFACEMIDVDGTGMLKPNELTFVLKAMNSTASYFGDPVMTQEQIEQLTDEVFKDYDKDGSGELLFTSFTGTMGEHNLVQSFVSGKGTVRYGSSR